MLGGLGLMLVGALLLSDALSVDVSAWDLFAPPCVFGAGTGLMPSRIGNLTLSAVRPDEASMPAASRNTFKETGTSPGTALIGSVLLLSSIGAFTGGVLTESGARVTAAELPVKERLAAEIDSATGGSSTSRPPRRASPVRAPRSASWRRSSSSGCSLPRSCRAGPSPGRGT